VSVSLISRRHASSPAAADVPLDPVGEEQEPCPVAVLQRGEDEQGGDLRRHLRFDCRASPASCDALRSTAISAVNSRSSANTSQRLAHPGGHVPVDRADLVSGWYGRTSENAIPRPLNTE